MYTHIQFLSFLKMCILIFGTLCISQLSNFVLRPSGTAPGRWQILCVGLYITQFNVCLLLSPSRFIGIGQSHALNVCSGTCIGLCTDAVA
jgi:hypothetical protein